jgi:hypothetical protein
MEYETVTVKEAIELEKKITQFGDFKEFDHEPTKEEILGAISDIVGELMDELKTKGKEIYDVRVDSFIIVPKKPKHGYGSNTIGVKLLVEI